MSKTCRTSGIGGEYPLKNTPAPLSKIGIYVAHYGCCLCQRRHFDAQTDGLFEAHRGFQSKHGIDEMPLEAYAAIESTAASAKKPGGDYPRAGQA